MTISFEVIPECGLKNENIEFILGTPINQMISALQNVPRIVKNIQFIYCPKEPFSKDICINLKDDGIRLIFDSKQQVLKIIEVYAPSKLSLYFGQEIFSTPDQPADIQKVQGCFGATHPGEYDDLQKLFLLKWRGISFAFPAKDSSAVQSTYPHGLGSLHFSNSSIPQLERMTIFYGSSLSEIKMPSQPTYTLCGTNKLNKVDVIQDDGKIKGLKINFSCEWSNDGGYRKSENTTKTYEKIIMFDCKENQVISDLGAPSRIFYKSDEKMLIQKGGCKETKNDEEKADYFFNYFTMGLDILFNCKTRRVIKFVLHTNIPGHYDFGIYSRCHFNLKLEKERIVIDPYSKFEEFNSIFTNSDGEVTTKPVVLNRGGPNEEENPFGATFCYGTNQMIFEVMENGYIGSVILFE